MVGSLLKKRRNSGRNVLFFSHADKLSVMPESTDSEEEAASHASDEDKDGDKKPADPSVELVLRRVGQWSFPDDIYVFMWSSNDYNVHN